jgi:tetratricopeptide (TPR) repeat protein
MIVDAEIFGGLSAYRLGDWAAARFFWHRAARDYARFYAEPPSPSRGFTQWMAGRHRDAAKTYEELVGAGDDNAIGLPATNAGAAAPYLASLRELAAGDVAASMSSARTAIARLPGYKDAYFVLGLCDLQRRDRPAARRAFLESLESNGTADPGDFLTDGGFAAFDSIAFLLVLENGTLFD